MHCYILTPWPIIVSVLTCQLYFFCTYYSHATETSLLCQSVFSYDRITYSPQRLSLTVQLWGMFPPSMYHTHTYKSCRHDQLQVNILQRLSLATQLWDVINYTDKYNRLHGLCHSAGHQSQLAPIRLGASWLHGSLPKNVAFWMPPPCPDLPRSSQLSVCAPHTLDPSPYSCQLSHWTTLVSCALHT